MYTSEIGAYWRAFKVVVTNFLGNLEAEKP
jgi:hypothetical protein